MKRIAIVGAGQSGLQLALGLLDAGYDVTVVSNRTGEEIRAGKVMSSQCMFDTALQAERDLGIDFWAAECPTVDGIQFSIPGPDGDHALRWAAKLDAPAQSVDQRVKIPDWMREFERRGGELVIEEAGVEELERHADSHDLVIVAAGKGPIASLFERDAEKSPYDKPQRVLALTYVTGLAPRPGHSAVCFNLIPGVGEYFVFPALTTTGPCEIMVFEGVPGGPMDCWDDVTTPEEHLARSKEILEKFLPWEAERARYAELTDDNGVLTGRFAPTVRKPVATLPSGRQVLGMADAVVLNDPITGQGANNAAKTAEIYLKSILDHRERDLDAAWMQQTFDRYWRGYAQWVVWWTNALLAPPPPHVHALLGGAAELPPVATAIANGFDDPRTFYPWWFDAAETDRFLRTKKEQWASDRFDRRDFRNTLGQFATGVTVVTTRTPQGDQVGVTANSFTSVSLDPPLVLWCQGKQAPSAPVFQSSKRFAVNILAANQHHLSRQFATPADDKFAGVQCTHGTDGVPLLDGAIARFLCRTVSTHDGGDHLIHVGEVENYERFDGEPLVFHSGYYRVATRHPEFPEG